MEKILLVAILFVGTIFTKAKAEKQVKKVFSPHPTTRSRWAIGNTYLLNFTLNNPNTSKKTDVYECPTISYRAWTYDKIVTLGIGETTYYWEIPNKNVLKAVSLPNFQGFQLRYLLFFPEGSTRSTDRFYVPYHLVEKTAMINAEISREGHEGEITELCDDGSGGNVYTYLITWYPSTTNTEVTYEVESVTFYECKSNRVRERTAECVKIGTSNAYEKLKFVPTIASTNSGKKLKRVAKKPHRPAVSGFGVRTTERCGELR